MLLCIISKSLEWGENHIVPGISWTQSNTASKKYRVRLEFLPATNCKTECVPLVQVFHSLQELKLSDGYSPAERSAQSSATIAKIASESFKTEFHRSSSNPFLVDTSTSTSVSGCRKAPARFELFNSGKDHSSFVGVISYLMINIETSAGIWSMAKRRPGHNIVPPPKGLKAFRLRDFAFGSSLSFIKRLGFNSSTSVPQRVESVWKTRPDIWIMESFFRSHCPLNTYLAWHDKPKYSFLDSGEPPTK